ncbi:hypothetical protein D3C86_1219830 [compost metagenome]
MRRVVRFSKRAATWASSSAMFLLTAAGDKPNWRDAAAKPPCSTTFLNTFSAVR